MRKAVVHPHHGFFVWVDNPSVICFANATSLYTKEARHLRWIAAGVSPRPTALG